jgi:hypothetical protein
MIIVAFAALAITWIKWTQRAVTFPVSGTISCNGRPVDNGKIVFLPPSPAGQQATGQIINGNYSLTSFALNDGAFPGSYQIVIVSPSVPARFQSQATAGLSAMVQKGSNMINFDLQ